MFTTEPIKKLQIQHGHDGSHVILRFSQPIDNLSFTPEQAEAFIAAMRNSVVMLEAHKASPPAPAQAAPNQEAANG